MTDQIKHATLEEWIEALESGKYAQHRYALLPLGARLETSNKSCCMGVYCKISGYKGNADLLCYFSIVENNTGVDSTSCIKWNDEDMLSFPQIAQKLREQYLNKDKTDAQAS